MKVSKIRKPFLLHSYLYKNRNIFPYANVRLSIVRSQKRITDTTVRNFIWCLYRQRYNSGDTHFPLSFPAAVGIVSNRIPSARTALNIWLLWSVGYSSNEARRSRSPLYFEIHLPNEMLSSTIVSSLKFD